MILNVVTSIPPIPACRQIIASACFLLFFMAGCHPNCEIQISIINIETRSWILTGDSSVFFFNDAGDSASCKYQFTYDRFAYWSDPYCVDNSCFNSYNEPCEVYYEQMQTLADVDSLNIGFNCDIVALLNEDQLSVTARYSDSTGANHSCNIFTTAEIRNDTLYAYGGMDYFEEISLNGKSFSGVYHKVVEWCDPEFRLTDLYYSKDEKIVAFKIDDQLWVLK